MFCCIVRVWSGCCCVVVGFVVGVVFAVFCLFAGCLCVITTSGACFALSSSCSLFLLFCVLSVFCVGLLWVVSLLVVFVLLMLVVFCVSEHCLF